MKDWNKGCWSNIVVGILLLIIGSIEESVLMMFIGMFNLLWAGIYWAATLGLLKKNDANHAKVAVEDKS